MGYFKESLINDSVDKDPQRYCKNCDQQISDKEYYDNKGICNECKSASE
jgi:Zn finger protein HypA/HybF involved in hydrogenase expression